MKGLVIESNMVSKLWHQVTIGDRIDILKPISLFGGWTLKIAKGWCVQEDGIDKVR